MTGGIWPRRLPLGAFGTGVPAAGIGSKAPYPSAFLGLPKMPHPDAFAAFGIPRRSAGVNALLGDSQRRSFSEAEKIQVWIKGREVPGLSLADWRYDDHYNIISWSAYGDASSRYGWEVDHINPLALGGTNDLPNLRPLHCIANRRAGGLLGQAIK